MGGAGINPQLLDVIQLYPSFKTAPTNAKSNKVNEMQKIAADEITFVKIAFGFLLWLFMY